MAAHAKPTAVTAALVPDGWAGGPPCPMYEIAELSLAGARLVGAFLLEVDEQVLVEIGFPDAASLRVRARVIGVDRKGGSGMRVEFIDVDPGARAALGARIGR